MPIYLASVVLPPVAGTWLMPLVPPWLLWPGIAALTWSTSYFIPLQAMLARLRGLERRVRSRLGESGGTFVVLRPSRHPRLYDWQPFWDVGILHLEGSRLRYIGEQIRFEISAREANSVESAVWLPEWEKSNSILLDTSYGFLCLTTLDRGEESALLVEIQAWSAQRGAETPGDLPPPRFPAITTDGTAPGVAVFVRSRC